VAAGLSSLEPALQRSVVFRAAHVASLLDRMRERGDRTTADAARLATSCRAGEVGEFWVDVTVARRNLRDRQLTHWSPPLVET
jgi:hypothetical protein